MTPSAQLALQDFVRYQGENGCTLYFEQFLKDGWDSLDSASKHRFAGLRVWRGVRELTNSLGQATPSGSMFPPLIAGRTANLVKMAARVLFQNCRRVLLTDLTWPAYGRIALRQASRQGGKITWLRLRQSILEHKTAPEEIVSKIVRTMQRLDCDGVLLPEVSHDGVRLPVQDLANALRERSLTPMTVIDGAQAFAHVPIEHSLPACDFYVAGSHKWLGAYLPLGIAFCPQPETRALFCRASAKLDDPLLSFLQRLHNRNENRFSETVNLTPLFTCQGASADLGRDDRSVADNLAVRLDNAATLVNLLSPVWRPVLPAAGMRCGILLLKAPNPIHPADAIRSCFLNHRVALTVYDDATLRLSMPKTPWTPAELHQLLAAFRAVETSSAQNTPHTNNSSRNRPQGACAFRF